MSNFRIKQSVLSGTIESSPSKSHTLRAVLFGSLAKGTSVVRRYLFSPDVRAMIQACRLLGAKIDVESDHLLIEGMGGVPKTPDDVIDAGNSGQILRFVAGIAALSSKYTVLTGDYSIRHQRPMRQLIKGLEGLGAFCVSTRGDGYAPIVIKGPIGPGKTELSGEDSQPISALLIATAFLKGTSEIFVRNPGEKPWVDVTLDWLRRINVRYENHNYERYVVFGHADYDGFDYTVSGDFSSLAFPVVAALITQSEITIQHVDMNDMQGDKKVIDVLKSMGANIAYDEKARVLKVNKTTELVGREIDVNQFIDALPFLAVLGCYAKGETRIVNGEIARHKECNRIVAITQELKRMGADIEELPDGVVVRTSSLVGATLQGYRDHRMVMSLSVAAIGAKGESVIEDIDSFAKSYPSFYEDMRKLGVNIERL